MQQRLQRRFTTAARVNEVNKRKGFIRCVRVVGMGTGIATEWRPINGFMDVITGDDRGSCVSVQFMERKWGVV